MNFYQIKWNIFNGLITKSNFISIFKKSSASDILSNVHMRTDHIGYVKMTFVFFNVYIKMLSWGHFTECEYRLWIHYSTTRVSQWPSSDTWAVDESKEESLFIYEFQPK